MIISKALLAGSVAATTKDDTRYFLDAIQVRRDGKTIVAEATNGHIAVRVTDHAPIPCADFPANGLTPKCDTTLIPADVVAATIKALPNKATIPVLRCAMIGAVDGCAVVLTTDLESPVQRKIKVEDRTFPALDRVWLKDTDGQIDIILGCEVLTALLAAVKGSHGGNKPRNGGSVRLTIPTKDALVMTAIRARWSGDTDITGEAVLMPMRA